MSDELNIKELRNVAEAFCAANLSACAAELCEWQNTGLLRDGKFRELGDLCEKYVGGHDGLRNAEHMVNYQACQLISRTAPSSPMGEELPDLPSNVVQVTRRIRRCESDTPAQVVLEHFAIEYARKVVTPYAERIRQLERELQTALKDGRKYQRKVDEKIMERRLQGVALLLKCSKCGADRSKEPCGNQQDCAMQGHAYIDGRTAGAAPAPAETVLAVEAPRSREWQPVTGPGQVRKGDKLRFKIGDRAYNERAKLILEPGTDKEEIVYDIGRNFYFITALVAGGRSNHKCVEVLAATPSPQQGKEGGND